MSDEQRRDSLADQAAAWVPPWERPRSPDPVTALPSAPSEAPEPSEPPAAEAAEERDTAHSDPSPQVPDDLGSELPLHGPNPSKIVGEADAGESLGGNRVGGPARAGGGRRRATVVPEPAPELPDAELRGALEAILLVVDEPVSELVLAQVLEQPAERIGPMLDEIAAGYTAAGNGFELRRAAGGWRLYTRPEYATYVERFVLDGQSVRLTQAALETLAVVAYKQPVTRSRISAIRGVNCDGVIRTLVTRGLVEECGTESDSGAFLYRTTTLFLEKLGLNTVDELPPLAPFLPDDVEELADATR